MSEESGYSPWMYWFAWYPVRLERGGWTWLTRVQCRRFVHESIWGAAPDPKWYYRLLYLPNGNSRWLLWRAWYPVRLTKSGGWVWGRKVRCRRVYESCSNPYWEYAFVNDPVEEFLEHFESKTT